MKEKQNNLLQDFELNETETKPYYSSENYSENMSLILFAISQVLFGISNFSLKYIQSAFSNYDIYSLAIWRYISFTLLIFSVMKFKNTSIIDIRNVQHKFWFACRTALPFFSFVCFMKSLDYIRMSTAVCFVCLNPVVVVIVSTIILREKFYIRYIIGIAICFVGVLFIVFNESKNPPYSTKLEHIDQISETTSTINTILGCIWSGANLIICALNVVSSKFLFKENIDSENQCFYMGVSNFILGFVYVIFYGKMNYEISFIFLSMLNAANFLLATYLTILGVKGVDINKTTPLNYFTLIVTTFLNITFLGEAFYFTDIVGSLIILGYNLYNSANPIKG